uniref:cellulose 1,4-beta-cellobiosidase (non-reducing end) n=1 Tax=Haptolina brevifila TaxID=156173 RepID=A0A7S2E5V8_9EUKA
MGEFSVVRNTGGGTSNCCKEHPIAAGALVDHGSGAISLELQPRNNQQGRNGARAYLADTCDEGRYDHSAYAAWDLLGRSLSFTVDLSSADCGCVAAFYLVGMNQNTNPGYCNGDYYCDAAQVCGFGCVEIDLMEANRRGLTATAHVESDKAGVGKGLGGSSGGAFTSLQYGPGGRVVDTRQQFRVRAYFAADEREQLSNIEITISQDASSKEQLKFSVADASYLKRLTPAVRSGLTPTMSYWSAWDTGFMDAGPCPKDDQDSCGRTVTFSDLAVVEGDFEWHAYPPPSLSPLPPALSPLPSAAQPLLGIASLMLSTGTSTPQRSGIAGFTADGVIVDNDEGRNYTEDRDRAVRGEEQTTVMPGLQGLPSVLVKATGIVVVLLLLHLLLTMRARIRNKTRTVSSTLRCADDNRPHRTVRFAPIEKQREIEDGIEVDSPCGL